MTVILVPGSRTTSVPVVISPTGAACMLQVLLTSDAAGASPIAVSNQVSFTSTGGLQMVDASIVTPASGTYFAFVRVWINGVIVGFFSQEEGVEIIIQQLGVKR